MPPLLSVVVPFHNVELYLAACLESLAAQTLQDLEVVLVDDGSSDGSLKIAERFVRRDPRFRLVRQECQGPGPARNTGVRHATGAYLAFADGDDVVPADAYALMVSTLESTGSDLACGGVRKIGARGLEDSALHQPIFENNRRKTHVRRFPELLKDRTTWNKIFRRAFWDEHGLEFPPGLYEDAPVTVPAHVLARSVDVLRTPVYYWRMREIGPPSITERRTEIENLEERMRSIDSTRAFLAEQAADLVAEFDRTVLTSDIRIYLRAYLEADEPWRRRFAELVGDYVDRMSDGVLTAMTALQRVTFHAARRRLLPELERIAEFTFAPGAARNAPAVRCGLVRRTWYADLPFLGDPRFPLDLYELRDELELVMETENVSWRDGRLRVEGHAHIGRLDAPREKDSRIEIEIRRRRPNRLPDVIRPKIERIHRPDVTEESGQAAASYDWSGFAFELDPARLGTHNGKWHVHLKVSAGGVVREAPLGEPAGRALSPAGREFTPGFRLTPRYGDEGRLQLSVHRMGVKLTGGRVRGDVLELTGRFPGDGTVKAGADAPVLVLTRGADTVRCPLTWPEPPEGETPTGDDPAVDTTVTSPLEFRARVPLAELASVADRAPAPGGRAVDWRVRLVGGDDTEPTAGAKAGAKAEWAEAKTERAVSVETDLDGLRATVAGHEFTPAPTRYGYLRIIERPARPVVTSVAWCADGTLEISGTAADESLRPAGLVLRRRRSVEAHQVPLGWQGARFTAKIVLDRASPAGTLPLAGGNWDLLASMPSGLAPLTIDHFRAADLPGAQTRGLQEVTVRTYQTDRLQLRIRAALTADERGAYARRKLVEHYYGSVVAGTARRASRTPRRARRPVDRIIFDSHSGTQYSCNPQAVYEEIQRRGTGLECVWASAAGQFTVPGDARIVLRGSRAYHEAVASARFVVGNCLQPPGYRKPDGQAYLQTWHGTPYKHIGYDLAEGGRIASEIIARGHLEQDVPQWDHLISPGPYVTGLLRRAFRYEGSVLEIGYPRNDLLSHPEPSAPAATGLRARIGVPAGRRVVLYMPTWREDAISGTPDDQVEKLGMIRSGLDGRALALDLARLAGALGDDTVILARRHHLDAAGTVADGAAIVDVTGYPDVRHLYLIADVLITDYSSAMFDFAVTGRPLLFFTPDLEYYQERLRGCYFDLADEAPGPLLRSTDEVVEALAELDTVVGRYETPYKAFRERYCPMDDGTAAAKVVDLLLGA